MKQTLNMRQQLSINLRYCYSSRGATQKMSASRSSSTTGINQGWGSYHGPHELHISPGGLKNQLILS